MSLFRLIAFVVCLLSLGPSFAASVGEISVKNNCLKTGEKVVFNALFDVQYTKPESLKLKQVYQFDCRISTKTCSGFYLDLTKREISVLKSGQAVGARLAVAKGSNFVIEWGLFRTFTIDLERRVITYRESGNSQLTSSQVEGFAESKCD